MRWLFPLIIFAAASCGDNVAANVSVSVPDAWRAAISDFVAFTSAPGLALGDDGDYKLELVDDPALATESYRIEVASDRRWILHAHDVLGAQYGLADALEHLGFRFRHPFDTYVPFAPVADTSDLGGVHAPEVRVRGLQLHTLHPIEGYFAFWEPGKGATNDAHRIIDWVVKNRGNFLQWVGLDDILDPARHDEWQAQTRELIDYAHARGIRVGFNFQLFGKSNLQLAFDLADDQTGTVPLADQIAARLPLITKDLPFDVYSLSFGEFFDADPQMFIDATNEVARQLHTLAPAAEMHAVVHVGATQRVTYMGRDLLYYFLVQYADPSIIPDIHTVMYYDLFEDAGGAYHHTDFSEHRQYLLDRMCANQPAAYFPETAYWVAFDDSVPMAVPLYVHSRWLDLTDLRAQGCGPLDEHLLFSSGWEWGYWLHDTTALRASYELPDSPVTLIEQQLAPDLGRDAALVVNELAILQHEWLLTRHLAAYEASRDVAIDAGRSLGVVSQPDRVTFDDLVALADPTTFAPTAQAMLDYAGLVADLDRKLESLSLPDSRWARELRDGLAIDVDRAYFIADLYQAVLAHVQGHSPDVAMRAADAALADAKQIVARRASDLHDTHERRLVAATPNKTFYQFGYLYMADTLCYWKRELAEVKGILGDASVTPPGCLFPGPT